jgi:hypothetical protein
MAEAVRAAPKTSRGKPAGRAPGAPAAANGAHASAAAKQAAPVAPPASVAPPAPVAPVPASVAELRVTGNLMTLKTGLFCVFRQSSGTPVNPATGLPGVRLSLPPGRASRPDAVTISTFRDDGWLGDETGAALVRVAQGPAQVLVTIYQAPNQPPDAAPRLQVLQLSAPGAAPGAPAAAAPAEAAAPLEAAGAPREVAHPDVTAHMQRAGDVGAAFGDWIGTRGSKLWIEGFALTPQGGVAPEDLEYQAVLGRGWLSPWVSEGKFCGSRGMALPLLGLRIRLRGPAAAAFECGVTATFVDGSEVGPITDGEACEAESLAPLEAFKVTLERRGAVRPDASAAGRAKPAPARKPAPPPAKRTR